MASLMRTAFARNATGMIGVAVATAVATRILPPVMAQMTGMARGAAGHDPFHALAQDHRHILSLLDQLTDNQHNGTFSRTQRLLRLKRRLTAHALAEENVIYPLLRDKGQREDKARQLYEEHAEMKMHLHALEEMPKDDAAWMMRAQDLKRLVDSHIREEEDVEFPALQAMMDDKTLSHVMGCVQREKAMLL